MTQTARYELVIGDGSTKWTDDRTEAVETVDRGYAVYAFDGETNEMYQANGDWEA